MQTRSLREGRLAMARSRLATANEALRIAHLAGKGDVTPARRENLIQRAQEHVITLEQEVALLSNGLEREYPDADSSYASEETQPDDRRDDARAESGAGGAD
jgi:hypothetical protein